MRKLSSSMTTSWGLVALAVEWTRTTTTTTTTQADSATDPDKDLLVAAAAAAPWNKEALSQWQWDGPLRVVEFPQPLGKHLVQDLRDADGTLVQLVCRADH